MVFIAPPFRVYFFIFWGDSVGSLEMRGIWMSKCNQIRYREPRPAFRYPAKSDGSIQPTRRGPRQSSPAHVVESGDVRRKAIGDAPDRKERNHAERQHFSKRPGQFARIYGRSLEHVTPPFPPFPSRGDEEIFTWELDKVRNAISAPV